MLFDRYREVKREGEALAQREILAQTLLDLTLAEAAGRRKVALHQYLRSTQCVHAGRDHRLEFGGLRVGQFTDPLRLLFGARDAALLLSQLRAGEVPCGMAVHLPFEPALFRQCAQLGRAFVQHDRVSVAFHQQRGLL